MTEGSRNLSIRVQALSAGGFWLTTVVLSAIAVAVVAGIVVLIVLPTHLWAGWQPVLLAVGVVLLVPVIGLLPLLGADRSQGIKVVQAAQVANAVRLGVAAVASLIVLLLLSGRQVRVAFGIWMIGLYLVSLAVEMSVLAIWVKGRQSDTRV